MLVIADTKNDNCFFTLHILCNIYHTFCRCHTLLPVTPPNEAADRSSTALAVRNLLQ